MMEEINFNWIRGDDEFETLIIENEDDKSPVDLSNSRFDLHIVPDNRNESTIKLSSATGEITVNQYQLTLHVAHSMTEGVNWKNARWDLQRTTENNIVCTLCGGKVTLKHDITKL